MAEWRELLGAKRYQASDGFWGEAFALQGSITRQVSAEVAVFVIFSLVVCLLDYVTHPDLGVDVAPYEVAGAALGLLLVLRTNAGYDRWWEGRKLWGGIVNQSRTLSLTALANGPDDNDWRSRFVHWTAAFGHVCRYSLRSDHNMPAVARLLGEAEAAKLASARHMPTAVSLRIAAILREAADAGKLDRFAFLVAEQSRNQLIDHIGGCERILKSPLPKVYGINIRRFILLFMFTLPFALLPRVGWLTPLVTALVAYPILSLDRIGVELQNPFSLSRVGHLPLDEITKVIENDLLALLENDDILSKTPPTG